MDILDKVKQLAGDHGVTAKVVLIEAQDPGAAIFGLTDKLLKFDVEVRTTQEAVILLHRFDLFAEWRAGGEPRLVCAAFTVRDKDSVVVGDQSSWPYKIFPGTVVTDRCDLRDVDLKKSLLELGATDIKSALTDASYRFFVRFSANVEGTPVDAHAEADLRVTE